MVRLDRTEQSYLEVDQGWHGLVRFCFGMMSFAAAICLGFCAYSCWLTRDIARALGGHGDKSKILGVTLPFPIMMTLLVIFGLVFAFAAVFAFFFPAQSK